MRGGEEVLRRLAWPKRTGLYCRVNGLLIVVDKDGSRVTTVVATPGQGPDGPLEMSYMDSKIIGNGSFGVVYQAKLCDTGEMIAIKKVLQDKRFKVSSNCSKSSRL